MNLLLPQGRFPEATVELDIARDLDPLSMSVASSVGLHGYYARDYDAAVDALSRAIDLNDRFAFAHFVLRVGVYEMSRFDDALRTRDSSRARRKVRKSWLGSAIVRPVPVTLVATAVLNGCWRSLRRYVSAALLAQNLARSMKPERRSTGWRRRQTIMPPTSHGRRAPGVRQHPLGG